MMLSRFESSRRARRAPRRTALAIALFCLCAVPLALQEPKVGNSWYEDAVDLGFKVKVPKDWNFIPPTPLERNLIGKYAPPNSQYVNLGGDAVLFLNLWLVKFDRRPETLAKKDSIGGVDVELAEFATRDIHAWMKSDLDEGKEWKFDKKSFPKPLKGVPVSAEYYVFDGESVNGALGSTPQPIKSFVAVYTLSDKLKIALIGVGPGDKKWRSYENAYESMAKSLDLIEVERIAQPAGESELHSPRARKRAELKEYVAKSPEWKLYETENYFVISNNTDEVFLAELRERLEALRLIFLKDYPPEKARHSRVLVKPRTGSDPEPSGGGEGDGEGDGEGEDPGATPEEEPNLPPADSVELSRSSVVRVCADESQYVQYGGSPGAPGFWNSLEQELVLFDDRQGGGRGDTWVVLNHEAFHQYIYYFYGSIAPHSWYNEGTGDFYSGYEYKHKRFSLAESPWRIRTIQQMIREGSAATMKGSKKGQGYVPLKELVRWSKGQYYGDNEYTVHPAKCYAQGWSLIWFLRTGEKNKAKGWQSSWGKILDVYLETLAETGKLDEAVDKAFEGVDWEAFEKSWVSYIG